MDQPESTAANLDRRSRRRWLQAHSVRPFGRKASSRRRWLQFSLRTAFIVLTVFAIWGGVIANRAREQREATAAIHRIGGHVFYDWQFRDHGNCGPAWLRRLIGDDFFQKAVGVDLGNLPATPESDIVQVIPHLKRLRYLQNVFILAHISKDTKQSLEAALPHCDIYQ